MFRTEIVRARRFGGGHDLHVAGNANANTSSYTSVGHSYVCPAGHNGETMLTGARVFQALEVEVFRVKGLVAGSRGQPSAAVAGGEPNWGELSDDY